MKLKAMTKKLTLVAAVSAALAVGQIAMAGDGMDVNVSNAGFSAAPLDVAGFVVMNVRIVDPDGFLVADYRSQGEDVSWTPGADDPDGQYSYEVVVVSGAEAAESTERETGRFSVEGGVVIPEQISVPLGQADDDDGVIGRIAGAVLDFLVPEAHAAALTASGSQAQLFFDDTDTVGAEFLIFVDDDPGGPFFQIFDFTDSHNWFSYISSGTTGFTENSIFIEGDGDIGLANFGFFFDRSASRFGIGTSVPAVNLQINDAIPEMRFFDETDSGTMDIQYDGNALRFEGNTGQDILTMDEIAPAASIHVGGSGEIGLGTSSPQEELHITNSGIAQLRLESTGTAVTDFFRSSSVFDIEVDSDANGSFTFPFRIEEEPPTGTLVLLDALNGGGAKDGFVGMGTTSPSKKVHILGSDSAGGENNTTALKAENVSGIPAKRFMLQMVNNGATGFFFRDTSTADEWQFANTASGEFTASYIGTGGSEMIVRKTGEFQVGPGGSSKFRVTPTGAGFFAGLVQATGFTQSSDRNKKQNFRDVDPKTVLAKVNALDISRWNFKQHNPEADHIGPMAQDFYKSFGLGSDDKHISPLDMASVALAAVKGLQMELAERDAEIASLRTQMQRVDQLEASLKTLMDVMPQTGAMPVALKQGAAAAF